MKLTRTEQKLLKRSVAKMWKDSPARFAVVWGHITSRRNGRYGMRDIEAATKLVKRGLAFVYHRTSGSEPMIHQFGSDHWHETSFELTPAGIELAQSLID